MALVHSDNDLTAPPYRTQPNGLYDAIITDPPYGVREMCTPPSCSLDLLLVHSTRYAH